MPEIKSRLPIEIVGIKTKSTSEGGIMYMVDNGQDHRITPVLPGRVTKIDGDEVYISHKEYIKEDYVSIYVIDGKIEVKKGQEVLQSTTIGVTDEEVELKIKHKGSFIDAKSFIGKTFNQSKGVTLSAKERARCIVKNLVGVPQTALGYKKEDDPCAFYNDKQKSTETDDVEDEDEEPKKDDEPKKDEEPSTSDESEGLWGLKKGLPSGQKGLPSGSDKSSNWDDIVQDVDFEEIAESRKRKHLVEEISRIKELLNL